MNELIELIEKTSYALIDNDTRTFADSASALNMKLWDVFPIIIGSYANPLMKDISQEALFWPAQMEKIINVLLEKDYFKIVDVLYYETRTQLLRYQNIIKERGLDIL